MTKAFDARRLEATVLEIVDRHALDGPGRYARWTFSARPPGTDEANAAPDGGVRTGGLDPYGCADAANLLYTLDRMPTDPATRAGFVESLQSLQDPADGLYHDATHHPIHTTAHCLAALELFDAPPRHRLVGLEPLADPDRLVDFLGGLDWRTNPWIESHRGAGVFAARHLARESTPDWEARYFAWVANATDPATGLPGGCTLGGGQRRDWFLFPMLAGAFHYLFNEQHARRPHAHAPALVDTCLEIRARALYPLGESIGFAEIDWVYCLNRAALQSGHRLDEARAALAAFAADYLPRLASLDPAEDPGLDDLHGLFGAVCAVAELQRALPGTIETSRPWRLVLDRRPFI